MTDHTRPPWADLPHGAAIGELLDALRDLTLDEARDMDAAWDPASDVAGDVAMWAVKDAARALVVADLVDQYGLTRDHLNILTAPARAVPRLAKIIDRALPTTAKEN